MNALRLSPVPFQHGSAFQGHSPAAKLQYSFSVTRKNPVKTSTAPVTKCLASHRTSLKSSDKNYNGDCSVTDAPSSKISDSCYDFCDSDVSMSNESKRKYGVQKAKTSVPRFAQGSKDSPSELMADENRDVTVASCALMCGTVSETRDLTNHLADKHSSLVNDYSPTVTQSGGTHRLREAFMENSKEMTVTKFNKLIKDINVKEVDIPGNGYCFISSVLVALAEHGIDKTMEVFSIDVMTEIRTRLDHYRQFRPSAVLTDEQFLEECSNYFQRGIYNTDYVDVCIGAVANALSVNLNVFQKVRNKTLLINYDCHRRKSNVNLFLRLQPGTKRGKYLDAHYTCYVDQKYYNENTSACKKKMVMTAGSISQASQQKPTTNGSEFLVENIHETITQELECMDQSSYNESER